MYRISVNELLYSDHCQFLFVKNYAKAPYNRSSTFSVYHFKGTCGMDRGPTSIQPQNPVPSTQYPGTVFKSKKIDYFFILLFLEGRHSSIRVIYPV